jgi:uncharacterized membrane protein YqjE
MSVPEGSGSGASPSLFASLRSFWSVVVAILYTRLDLVTAELEDEAVRGLKLILTGLLCVLSLFMAFFFATYFVIAVFWDNFEHRLWAIGGIFAIYFLAGAILFLVARHMILTRPRFLAQTLAELRRDAEGLSKSFAPTKEEPKP